MKNFAMKHYKIFIILLILILVFQSLLVTHYTAKKDSTRKWKMVFYQQIGDNPNHTWEGYLLFYGKHIPEKVYIKKVIDEEKNTKYVECERENFKNPYTGYAGSESWFLLNALAFSLPYKASYCFLTESDRPKSAYLQIKWEENGETKYSEVRYK